jgi:hypothetical protein
MPSVTWCSAPDNASTLQGAAVETMQEWHVRSAFVRFWVQTACDRARDLDNLRVVLDYDPDAGLLSFDAFSGDRRVYGADDWIG